METLPTQDVVDGDFSEDDEQRHESQAWGRLLPLGTSFTAVDLINEEYTLGRGENCDIPFNGEVAKKHQCFQAYSKIHFKLLRKTTSKGVHVFLEDTSSNGTFINGEKVAYVYLDLSANEDDDLPQEIKEKYTMTKVLGRGACGEVKLAFMKGSCEKFAVKIISKKKFSVGGKHQVNVTKQIMSEVKILKALKHPCIIRIEDVIDTPDVLYIILELVEGGELFDKVVELGLYDEPTAKLLFYQMVLAVNYLHDKGITHRDLKPENILLHTDSKETLIKVTDFGLSKFVDAGSIMQTFCGTPTYLAPEILKTAGTGSYTKAIDCWSLGVILYICLVGYPPFSDERKDLELPKQILGGHYTFPKQYWKDISDDAIDLVKKLLTVDPEKRITLSAALNHPWLKDDDMKSKANALMYPDKEGMVPPSAMPKKRTLEEGEEPVLKRKGSSDTNSPVPSPSSSSSE
ncbi:hypothetical protein CHS0354_025403 [Potamilus streckersoni]|uniref:Serine/threonine-protein kinase Chk2 n=1 Tax=Potamilus streckersoni TaxID=2493646 RepID=A0AAE0VZQ0_9BIVA|nr:hypothetical protein CHS0354_025403 [Potamilus streckersoni]